MRKWRWRVLQIIFSSDGPSNEFSSVGRSTDESARVESCNRWAQKEIVPVGTCSSWSCTSWIFHQLGLSISNFRFSSVGRATMTSTIQKRPAMSKKMKQIPISAKNCANPLFFKWIKEWLDESVARNLSVRFGYRKALVSLLKYPLVLRSGRDCGILQDFGPKLCAKLDRKLAEYLKANPKGMQLKTQSKTSTKHNVQNCAINEGQSSSEPQKLACAESDDNKLEPKKYYNAHSVSPPSSPQDSNKMQGDTKSPNPAGPSIVSCATSSSSQTSSGSPYKQKKKATGNKHFEDLILQPENFEVILLVDNAETLGNTKQMKTATCTALESLNVKFDVRSLKVGDFAWIAKDLKSDKELILPYIVERKRLDDLARSIKDGRYREQKFRLNQCGIENRIYLIESKEKEGLHLGLPISTIRQASINTQIHGGFSVKHTTSHADSMRYLATLTRVITRTYKDKILVQSRKEDKLECNIKDDLVSLMGFEDFNRGACKIRKWRVREMFIKHLLQLRGLSVEKAIAIVQKYPSPRALVTAYALGDGISLLAKIQYSSCGKCIGPVISAAIYKLYTDEKLT